MRLSLVITSYSMIFSFVYGFDWAVALSSISRIIFFSILELIMIGSSHRKKISPSKSAPPCWGAEISYILNITTSWSLKYPNHLLIISFLAILILFTSEGSTRGERNDMISPQSKLPLYNSLSFRQPTGSSPAAYCKYPIISPTPV